MARTKKRSIWQLPETAGYGVDASANGSAYLWVPTIMDSISELSDGREPLQTNYGTGRNWSTAPIQGPDGWEFSYEIPMIGFAVPGGDGAAPPVADWFDNTLQSIFGTATDLAGEGVAACPGVGSITMTTDAYSIQDLIPIWEAAIPAAIPRTQWALLETDDTVGGYTLAPSLDEVCTAAAVAYATRHYTFDDDGGLSLSYVYREDDLDYTLLGGRITSASISAQAGEIYKMRISVRGDNRTQETKGSLPAAGNAPACSPLICLRSPFWFAGTKYETDSTEIDLGLSAAIRPATSGTHGRGGDLLISAAPTVTVRPLRTDALLELKRAQTQGRLMMQLGGGVLTGGILNTMAFSVNRAVAASVTQTDENGRQRAAIQFGTFDAVTFSGSTADRVVQLYRA